MVKLNQKGQEFSVFKLLISAIIAIVVLTLLLQILNIIDFNPNTDPSKAAENLLNDMDSSTYTEKVSKKLDFKKENSISAAALANNVGLDNEQICLGLASDLESTGDFVLNQTHSLITYNGDSSVRVKLAGICAPESQLDETFIEENTAVLRNTGFSVSDCSFPAGLKACVLVLIRSNE